MLQNNYSVIGIMSGTSLDGVDIAYCDFWFDGKWNFKINCAKTYEYTNEWYNKLKNANNLNTVDFLLLHKEYGSFIGNLVNVFIKEHSINKVDLISSHGHTIFHQPEYKLNFQLGDGSFIAAQTLITTVSDFRTLDIALGGQGAPLVPIGDELLFSNYDYCLNIGGISNISFKYNNKRIAFDICPSNIVLNYLANKISLKYDEYGNIARKGKINEELLLQLNELEYYYLPYPKSLGREWIEKYFIPIIDNKNIPLHDKLATCVEHIAIQISKNIFTNGKILITGGGAHNKYLIERISNLLKNELVIPDDNIVNYKEALIFAFLGLLRWNREVNVLKSVTGATHNTISGNVYIIDSKKDVYCQDVECLEMKMGINESVIK